MGQLRIERLSYREWGPIDLRMDPGECICLSGASGAGKTLLLRAISDLDPHEGEVSLDGCRREEFSAPEWRRRVGMLPAESLWWFDTVGPHLLDPDQSWFHTLGFDLDVSSWPVSRLSTGERQRLSLIRLLCNRPEVLLLDEPTASCDPAAVAKVEGLIDAYRSDSEASVLWVSHDPDQISRVADRHLRMHDRELIG